MSSSTGSTIAASVGGQAGLANEARVGRRLHSPVVHLRLVFRKRCGLKADAQNKKSGPEGPTLRVEMIMSKQMLLNYDALARPFGNMAATWPRHCGSQRNIVLTSANSEIIARGGPREGLLLHSGSTASRPAADAPIGGPFAVQMKAGCARTRQQDPARIVADVGGDAQLGAGLRMTRAERPAERELTSRRLSWRFFGQGSGNRMNARRSRRVRQPAQQRAGIVGMQPNVGELAVLDRAQHLDDAVLERLAADEADIRVVRACQSRCSPPPKPISSHTS